ncbi:hypothetical protein FJ364_05125, partial [Candidatus Dependentiae bacterium]|nr:hypothetical protein [Candidatus Dependentiae bacterium]
MKIPTRLHYLWSMPPLWIIQIGKDQLVFSQIIEKGIGKQEQLYLDSHTILPHKIANPSALSKGLRHFFSQKKHTRLRAWFLLPQEFYTSPLLPHELFQFLISIK